MVAGGNQHEKELYENLSSPIGSTTLVLSVAAIVACEGRSVTAMDIGGAFLNADIAGTEIQVHMRLNKVLTSMLVQINPDHARFVDDRGTYVVELDKALYGCVEADILWYTDLCATMRGDGFAPNPYDPCVYNKIGSSGSQITVVMHVDDLYITDSCDDDHEAFEKHMRKAYREIKVNKGNVINYIGMSFDYTVLGQVSITMENCDLSIL